MKRKIISILGILILTVVLTGCGTKKESSTTSTNSSTSSTTTLLKTEEIFTDRDLEQNVDTEEAEKYEVKDNENITITKEGIYVITGSSKNTTIIVDSDDEAKVQLVLDNLEITNESTPCIYVKNADKVFVTTQNDNKLTVSNTFTADGETNTDAVIYSKDDLVLNGTGSLIISSTDNGITSKDDLKITGGTIKIDCVSDGLEANDSIVIYDGTITVNSKKDGLHAEYSEDDSVGYIYIKGGEVNITASDDAIHATTILEIEGGTLNISGKEGLEATKILINDGTINIKATDDGMNAGQKSNKYEIGIEINGGEINIDMGQGDTDAIDSNGSLTINGGTINITAQSPFDYDGEGQLNGGEVIVNGSKVEELTNQMMGGPGGGQRGGRVR